MEQAERQVTGDDIISELIRNAETGAFTIRYSVLLPSVFNVYLHPSDYQSVRPLAEIVKREAARALDEHIAQLNRKKQQSRLMRRLGAQRAQRTYKPLSHWEINFHSDREDNLRQGEIEIYSEFAEEEAAELGAGAKTTFVSRHTNQTPAASSPTARAGLATLRYKDSSGEKTFVMNRDEIVIGRGGKTVWVDLRLDGPSDISREHCRIRRDNKGKFFIKDLSQYGTSVNGSQLASSVERLESGDKIDRNVEFPLPCSAEIVLADAVTLHFAAETSND
ncbi:MAG: DUF3662 domain-containing protein [Acidobacteriales bacterium]|nr:DUF3662 domain-containing protein [Terriglobales bacterium]